MTEAPLVVIGIGLDGRAGLGPEARAFLARAEILAGGKRHLEFFPEFSGNTIVLEGDLPGWIEKLTSRDRHKQTVVLATGDPLFFGIGRRLLEAFPKEELLFLPHVSSIALAFARLKETWNDACMISLHGRPLQTIGPALERGEPKIAVFTDAENNPAAIARIVCAKGLGRNYVQWVCENLGGDDERITRWSPLELQDEDFAPLNVVVLLRVHSSEPEAQARAEAASLACASGSDSLPLLGLPESALRHRGEPCGLITKREVRLQALGFLEMHHGDVLWDIGAGSGSVSLEAARLAPTLAVFAIEKATEALAHLRENVANFGLGNVHLVAGEAPESLAELPDPNAVFVGGNGGRLLEILDHVMHQLKPGGRLVLSCIALETFSHAWNWFSERRLDPQATSLQLAHSRPLGNLHRFEPDNPIFLLRVKKP
jgi:precorrin-6B C5,15-methyltransferase / cobalt-precorrin-6B C5,C15-methyltransferase